MKNNVEHITGDLQWDGLHRPKIYYAVASVCCGIFLSVVDGNICNVALPTISQELGVSSADSIWVVNAFQLVIMMTLLSFSSLGELFSYKRVYVSGVVLFTVGSLFCAMSHTLPLLIASRAFQGIGAAMMMSVNTTLVKIIYPKKYLGKGVGINATVVALAAVTGPTLAAGILSFASWPWLFAINIPIGIVTFFMAFRHLPDNPTHVEGRHFNVRDALLNAAVFGLLIGCIEMYSHGASLTTVLVGVALLLLLGFIYVRTQLHRQYPMLPFDLLRIPVFSIFFQSPNNHMLLSSAPNHRAGSAGGMLATARLVGQSTGAALVALFFHLFGDGAPHDAMLLAGALTICGALSSVIRLGLRPPVNER